MTSTIITKNSAVAGDAPAAAGLQTGELAVNVADKKLWVGDASNNPVEIASDAGGADPFPGKPKDEPIVIVFTGQSNCSGVYVDSSMVTNSSVFDWQTTVAAPTGPAQTGTFAWNTANPNWDSGFQNIDSGSGLIPFVGMKGNGTDPSTTNGPMGNIGWTAADLLQKQTGRDVYMITVHYGAANIAQWEAGAACATRLNTQVVAALAAITDGPAKPDLVIWSQGESDSSTGILATSAEDYWTAWSAFKVASESVWTEKDKTRWLVCGTVSYWETEYGYWGGLDTVIQNTSQYVNFIPAADAGEGVLGHFNGLGYKEMGGRVNAAVLAGVSAKPLSLQIYRTLNAAEPLTGNEKLAGVQNSKAVNVTPEELQGTPITNVKGFSLKRNRGFSDFSNTLTNFSTGTIAAGGGMFGSEPFICYGSGDAIVQGCNAGPTSGLYSNLYDPSARLTVTSSGDTAAITSSQKGIHLGNAEPVSVYPSVNLDQQFTVLIWAAGLGDGGIGTAANPCIIRSGFVSTTGGYSSTSPANSMFFELNANDAIGNLTWKAVVSGASGRVEEDTGVSVTTNVLTVLRVKYVKAEFSGSTLVTEGKTEFFINGVLAETIIDTALVAGGGTARAIATRLSMQTSIEKTGGTTPTARNIYVMAHKFDNETRYVMEHY